MKEVLLKDYILAIESGTRGKGGATAFGVPSLGAEHLNADGTISWDKNKMKYIPVELFKNLKSGIVHNNDVLIVKDGATTGKVAYVEKIPYSNVAINEHVFLLRPKSEILPKYLFYYLMSANGNKKIMSNFRGATVGGIGKNFIEMPINLISIDVQQHVVNVLDKISHIITLRKKQLKNFDELVKSRFIEMFGDVNVNSKKWALLPLGELCKIVRGASPRPIEKFLGGTVPWIKIGDATENDDIFLTSTKEHIIQDGILKSRLVKANSLIFANCGVSLGFARIITFNGCIHDGWLALEDIDSRLNKIFLLQSLNQMTEYFRKLAPAGTQPNLNTSIMKTYKQIVPPLQLQKEFVSFLEQTNKSKLEIQKSIDKLEILKKSLMQQYFG